MGVKSRLEAMWCVSLSLLWPIVRLFPRRTEPSNTQFSIGVTTFMDRFSDLFVPMLRNIAHQFGDTQIIVYANGHVDEQGQVAYIKEIRAFCERYSNVELYTLVKPEGLSKIWNRIISHSRAEKVLMLNDDLAITPQFRRRLMRSGVLTCQIALINNIWSHYLISKNVIARIGEFDEAFREIGGEDDDYTFRLATAGVQLESRNCLHVKNRGKPLRRNSYGHNMVEGHRYSEVNAKRLSEKWIMQNRPFAGSTYVARNELYVARRKAAHGGDSAELDALEQSGEPTPLDASEDRK